MKKNNIDTERLEFWNSRARLGVAAGSDDVNLKKIEMEAISRNLGAAKTVLDAGCGNAYTLLSVAGSFNKINFFGFDYSSRMVEEGRTLIENQGLNSRIQVWQDDLLSVSPASIQNLGIHSRSFDCVYTERSIINLNSFEEQLKSIQNLWDLVAPGGRLILCESFIDGLIEINNFRESLGLDKIEKPWHNRYLTIDEIKSMSETISCKLEIIEFSGSYYFVSRVINAQKAFEIGSEPKYDDPINLISLRLPSLPICGQSKLAIFYKN